MFTTFNSSTCSRLRVSLAMSKLRSAFKSILDDIAVNYLHKNARRLRKKYPPMAVFAHDYIGAYINVFGMYERDLLESLVPLIERYGKDSAVLDVGANIGNHAVFFFPPGCQILNNPIFARNW